MRRRRLLWLEPGGFKVAVLRRDGGYRRGERHVERLFKCIRFPSCRHLCTERCSAAVTSCWTSTRDTLCRRKQTRRQVVGVKLRWCADSRGQTRVVSCSTVTQGRTWRTWRTSPPPLGVLRVHTLFFEDIRYRWLIIELRKLGPLSFTTQPVEMQP